MALFADERRSQPPPQRLASAQQNPGHGQSKNHRNVVGAEIANTVKRQEAIVTVPINDKFGEQDPTGEDSCERGDLD